MSGPRVSPRRSLRRWQAAHPVATGRLPLLVIFTIVVAAGAAGLASAWSILGPGPAVADRIRAVRDPLMVGVEYRRPNPFEGAPGEVWITLAHDATRNEVNGFICGVVVPAGGAEMYQDGRLRLWQADQQGGDPGFFAPPLACPPVADARPWVDPTSAPTEPPPFIYGSCSDTYANAIDDCGAERAAALLAVGHLGYYPLSIEIHPGGFPCGEPFEDRQPAETCPGKAGIVVAYVRFVGTDKVAALTLDRDRNGYVANVVAFQALPPSFDHFLYWSGPPGSSPTATPSGS